MWQTIHIGFNAMMEDAEAAVAGGTAAGLPDGFVEAARAAWAILVDLDLESARPYRQECVCPLSFPFFLCENCLICCLGFVLGCDRGCDHGCEFVPSSHSCLLYSFNIHIVIAIRLQTTLNAVPRRMDGRKHALLAALVGLQYECELIRDCQANVREACNAVVAVRVHARRAIEAIAGSGRES